MQVRAVQRRVSHISEHTGDVSPDLVTRVTLHSALSNWRLIAMKLKLR